MNNRIKKISFFYKKATLDNDIFISSESNNSKEDISYLQQKLIDAGFQLPRYGTDGILGSETIRAMNKFQKENGLPISNSFSTSDLKKLEQSSPDNKDAEATSQDSGATLLFGDSQMQGGIGQTLEAKYGGTRLSKPGSSAAYWIGNQQLLSELNKKPAKIIIQLNSNGISGTENLLNKIKSITPGSEVIWYGAPPAILKKDSQYKQVTTPQGLSEFNKNRQSMNNAVAGMIASSGLNAEFIDPFTDIFDLSGGQPYSCNNCDGIHVPQSVAQKFYS